MKEQKFDYRKYITENKFELGEVKSKNFQNSVLNENSDAKRYIDAVKLFKDNQLNPKYDRIWSKLFKGGKLPTHFLYRSTGKPTESAYNADVQKFENDKVDDFISQVLFPKRQKTKKLWHLVFKIILEIIK